MLPFSHESASSELFQKECPVYLPLSSASEPEEGLGLLGKLDVHGEGDPNAEPFADVLPKPA